MFEAEVQRGAMELDAAVPGWDEQIPLDGLSMHRTGLCVLGWTHGSYQQGVCVLNDVRVPRTQRGMDWLSLWMICPLSRLCRWSASRGFTLPGWFFESDDPRWQHLRSAWVALITSRRLARAAQTEGEPVETPYVEDPAFADADAELVAV